MRLTRYTDYSLRVLTYLGTHPERTCSIAEIAHAYDISQNHLMKVVHGLRQQGFVKSVRGRSGGVRLARPAGEINVGDLVRHTEDDFCLVDCSGCVIAPGCGLIGTLGQALAAFMAVLDGCTLADLVNKRADLARLLDTRPRAGATA
jgi:Rrf2 family nitric oxide-sensitive transcriptional repressor